MPLDEDYFYSSKTDIYNIDENEFSMGHENRDRIFQCDFQSLVYIISSQRISLKRSNTVLEGLKQLILT
jgi:hypothetical protein